MEGGDDGPGGKDGEGEGNPVVVQAEGKECVEEGAYSSAVEEG